MGRRTIKDAKIPVLLAKDRKRISDSINIDKLEIEDLQKQLKSFSVQIEEKSNLLKKTIIDLKINEELIKKQHSDIDKLNVEFTEVNNKVFERKKELELEKQKMLEDYNKKLNDLIRETDFRLKEVNELSSKIFDLDVEKQNLGEKIESIILEQSKKEVSFNETIFAKTNFIKELDKEIEQRESRLTSINSEIANSGKIIIEIEKESNKLLDLRNLEESLKQKLIEIQGRFDNLDNEVKTRMKGLDDREKTLENREKNATELEKTLKNQEKRIMTIGNTLQKHLDKQNIPIKIFE